MSKPDVTLIGPYPPPGKRHAGRSGVASYTANLARALAASGAEVMVVAPLEEGEPPVSRDGPVQVERRFRRGSRGLLHATEAVRSLGARLVHLQLELFLYGGPSALLSLPVALHRLRGIARTVITLHQVVDPGWVDGGFVHTHRVRAPAPVARAGIAAVQHAVARLADAVVVHESAFSPLVPGSVVVPHGVEVVAPPDRARARALLELDDRLTVLCFGFLAPYKGLEAALEAAERAGDGVRVVVAGGEHPRLAGRDSYARDLERRWGRTARFTGYVPEDRVPLWFAGADVALFPYPRPFASSGALALALAHGTPLLASPELARCIGAPPPLAAPAEPAALAARLADLAGNRRAVEELGGASRQLARGRSWPEVARRHLDLYEEVTREKGPARGRVRAG